ncbi:MAG: hypothetical protein ACYTGL_30325 [Planctomycetota bacterium]
MGLIPKTASKLFGSLGNLQTLISTAGPVAAVADPTGYSAVCVLLAAGLGLAGYDIYDDIQSGKKLDEVLDRLRKEVGKRLNQ